MHNDLINAYAEIDRLRYEAERWKHVAENKWGIDDLQKYQEEIDRLRSELATKVSVELLNVERKTCDRIRSENDRLRAAAVPVCVGQPLIRILAKDGAWQSEDGRCVIAADDLHRNDPYAEIDRLRAENASLKAEIDWHVEEIKRIKAGE